MICSDSITNDALTPLPLGSGVFLNSSSNDNKEQFDTIQPLSLNVKSTVIEESDHYTAIPSHSGNGAKLSVTCDIEGREAVRLAQGIADSADAAYEQAVQSVGPVVLVGNHHAKYTWAKERATARSRAASSGTNEARPIEFVYEPDSVWDTFMMYRIVKKTKKRIYVDWNLYSDMPKSPTGKWYDYHTRTFILDREEFEKTGRAKSKSRGYDVFYADPSIYLAELKRSNRPECFERLGVPGGATVEEIKAAYRILAKDTHPDRGGDAKEFVAIKEWFDQAMAYVGG
ncbi:DnaJ domain-containing protein [Aeoliella sp. SH292]|uniref:DnaJ domain-containing protein n=1 Tax=Aeoliella sp. SH292 TaxID=3454464 RepID=UPI003F9C75ED